MGALFQLTRKQHRIVNRCLQELFSIKALEPLTIPRLRSFQFPDFIARRVKTNQTGGELLLTDGGKAAIDRLAATLVVANSQFEAITTSDVESAVRAVYESCIQTRQQPESPEEFVHLTTDRITPAMRMHSFVAAMHGVKLNGIPKISLGALRLVASVREVLEESGVSDVGVLDEEYAKGLLMSPCIVGAIFGTLEAAKRSYGEQVHLAAGMLAVEAGATYERGATSFRIVPAFGRYIGGISSTYLFWNADDKRLGWSVSARGGQMLELTSERVAKLVQPGAFEHAFTILQKRNRTELEDAIARAVYWYGDAHRDSVPTMQFIKYWSCLECLLGGAGEELTETLAIGAVDFHRILTPVFHSILTPPLVE